jgi:signal transduction protein with GAF and PtsI domain
MQTERVTFLTTPDHKAALDAFATSNGMSVGHVVREATSQFIAQPTPEEEAELRALIDQVNDAVPKMNASIGRMLETLDRTHRETDAFLREMGVRA